MGNNSVGSSLFNRKKLLKSSAWVFSGTLFSHILRLGSNLILTRLLVPEMFGVMAIANTIMSGLWLCSYMGVEHNVIQSARGEEKSFLDAAWSFQVIRGFVLCFLALMVALILYVISINSWIPPNSVYADKQLPLIIVALSFIPLITGFESMKKHLASRNVLVKQLSIIQLGTQATGLVFMVCFALIHKSIWALVFGNFVQTILFVISTYLFLPGGTNKFVWNPEEFKKLFDFGKWLLLTLLLSFFIKNVDKLILGAIITPKLLGIYSIAIFILMAIIDFFGSWGARIALPMLSETHRQGDRKKLTDVHYKFLIPFDFGLSFVAGLLFCSGDILIEILYDDRYQSAGHMIQILAIMLLGGKAMLADQLYVSMGKPQYNIPVNMFQLIFLTVGIIPAYRFYGMDGVLYLLGINAVLALPVAWFYVRKLGILNLKKELVAVPAVLLGYGVGYIVSVIYNSIKHLLPVH